MLSIASRTGSLELRPDGFAVEALAGVLHPSWVHEAISSCGRGSRRVRQLPAQLAVWIVILMGLFRRHSYVNLLGMLFEAGRARRLWAGKGAPPCTSALTKARDRLGVEPLRNLFEKSAREWTGSTDGLFFHGRRVFALDGSSVRVPDTAENDAFFGRPPASRGHTSYPQLRIVTLRDVGTRLCRGVSVGPWRQAELRLAQKLLHSLDSGSLVLMDRGFISYAFMWDLYQGGADFVLRVKEQARIEIVHEHGSGDAIVCVRPHRDVRGRRPDVPKEWYLRRIIYRPPGGTQDIHLLTTLCLAEEIPDWQIAALYPERWEEETGYDELKTHLCNITTITQPTALRSKTPKRIVQEAYGLLIAYNALRATMALAAPRAELTDPAPARRVSFVHALERLRETVRDMMQAATTRLLERFECLLEALARVTVPHRPGRTCPRAVKRKMSNYPLRAHREPMPSG